MDKRPEIRDTRFITLQLVEDGSDGKKVRVRGEFARADLATENGRIYPRTLWEREIKRLNISLKERKVLGELDHPTDGKTLLSRASHLLTALEVKDDGTVVGEAEALDTAKGKDLQALFKSGAKIGVSSRGFGSVKANSEGKDVVQEDYRLATFDFVADPADNSAYPDPFYESKERTMGADGQKLEMTEEQVSQRVAEAVQDREARLRAEMSESLTETLSQLKTELREEVRSEMMTDPALAGARAALEKVKEVLRPFILPEDAEGLVREKEAEIARLGHQVAEQAEAIKGLEDDLDKLAQVARDAGYKYYMEKTLGSFPDADVVRNLIGPVGKFESVEDLKEALGSVMTQLTEEREKTKTAQQLEEARVRQEDVERLAAKKAHDAALEAANSEAEAALTEERERAETSLSAVREEMKELQQTNAELFEAVEKALEANKQQSLLLYTERRLTGNPRAIKIRKLLEAANIDDEADIDAIIKEHSGSSGGLENIEAVRARVRSLSTGRTHSPLEEEQGNNGTRRVRGTSDEENFQGLGVSLRSLRKASGLEG